MAGGDGVKMIIAINDSGDWFLVSHDHEIDCLEDYLDGASSEDKAGLYEVEFDIVDTSGWTDCGYEYDSEIETGKPVLLCMARKG